MDSVQANGNRARKLAELGENSVGQGLSGAAELMRVADSLSAPNSRYDEIYLAVATLFEHQKGAFSKPERELAADILKRVSKDVDGWPTTKRHRMNSSRCWLTIPSRWRV